MSELLKLNVSEHTEKKNGLTYLSWAWAWAEVLKIDPQATWEAVEFDGFPASFAPDGSALVKTVVTIKGHAKSCWLPVMDHRNKAIKNPDAFAVNTALVRCLTKCISMHGLGLYIYAGEDLPESDEKPEPKMKGDSGSPTAILFNSLPPDWQAYITSLAIEVENAFEGGGPKAAQDVIDIATERDELEGEHIAALFSKLPSKTRSQLKAKEPA